MFAEQLLHACKLHARRADGRQTTIILVIPQRVDYSLWSYIIVSCLVSFIDLSHQPNNAHHEELLSMLNDTSVQVYETITKFVTIRIQLVNKKATMQQACMLSDACAFTQWKSYEWKTVRTSHIYVSKIYRIQAMVVWILSGLPARCMH